MRKVHPGLLIGLFAAIGLWMFSRTERGGEVIDEVVDYGADVMTGADNNIRAFLTLIGFSEGTERMADPYRVVYGYKHTIQDLSDHPAITGEWRGERLPDSMCASAGLPTGCISTAAGRYQFIRGTWLAARDALGLPDFGPESQDRAALWLIERRGALEDVKAGRVGDAILKVRREWASLPGAGWGQGERSMASLVAAYQSAGGTLA